MLNPERQINITIQKEDNMQDILNIENPVVEFDEQARRIKKARKSRSREICRGSDKLWKRIITKIIKV